MRNIVKTILIIFIISSFFSLNFSIWLDGWKYRIKVIIKEISGNNLKNFQIPIEINTQILIKEGKMNEDRSDIRVADSDGISLLSYWIEYGCGSNNTRIWIKVPLINANSEKIIFVYYGNKEAESISNGYDVFEFFEDGEDNVTERWEVIDGSMEKVFDPDFNSTVIRIKGPGTQIVSKKFISDWGGPYEVKLRVKWETFGIYGPRLWFLLTNVTKKGEIPRGIWGSFDSILAITVERGGGTNLNWLVGNGFKEVNNNLNWEIKKIYNYTIKRDFNILEWKRDNITFLLTNGKLQVINNNVHIRIHTWDVNNDVRIANIQVRKFIYPEPMITLSREEIVNETETTFGLSENLLLDRLNTSIILFTSNRTLILKDEKGEYKKFLQQVNIKFEEKSLDSLYNIIDKLPVLFGYIICNKSTLTDIYYAYLISTKLDLFFLFYSKNSFNNFSYYEKIIPLGCKEDIIKYYIDLHKDREKKIDKIVISNLNSFETSLLAARFAALYNGFPIFINKTDDIKEKIRETYYWLRNLNVIEDFPEIVIVGNWDEIPFYEIVLDSVLGIKTYSDIPYSDLNNDNYPDFPIYSLCCNPTEISIQIEAGRLFKNNGKATIVSNYNSKYLFNGDAFYSKDLKNVLSKKFEVERYIQHFAKNETENIFNFIKISSENFLKIKNLIESDNPLVLLTIIKLLFKSLDEYAKFKEYDWQIFTGKLSPKLNSSIIEILKNTTFLFSFHLINNSKIVLFEDENKSFEIDYPFIPFIFFISHPSIYTLFFDNSLIFQSNLPTFSSIRNTIQVLGSPRFAIQMFSLNNSLAENFREVFIRNLENKYGIDKRTLYSLVFIGFNLGENQLEIHNSTLILENPCNISTIENITLIFCDADDYLISENYSLPIIYKKVYLPKFYSLNNISFEIKTKIVDYYFEVNETFPKEFFEIKEIKNINDYSELYFTIYPLRIYPNKSVEVLEYLKINYLTKPKIEIENLEYDKISKTLKIQIFSDMPRNLTLEIFPINFSQTIFVNGTREFNLAIDFEGTLKIKLKYFDFEIERTIETQELPETRILKISDAIEYIVKNYKREERRVKSSEEYFYELKTYSFVYKHEIKSLSEKFLLITPEYEYQVFQNSNLIVEKLRNAYGTLTIEIENGNKKINIQGKEKIKEYLNPARELLQKLVKYG